MRARYLGPVSTSTNTHHAISISLDNTVPFLQLFSSVSLDTIHLVFQLNFFFLEHVIVGISIWNWLVDEDRELYSAFSEEEELGVVLAQVYNVLSFAELLAFD